MIVNIIVIKQQNLQWWNMIAIYHKICDQLETYIADNQITGRMPGILKLSDELGLNRVTLGKAFRELERRGVVTICGTKGTFVNKTITKRTKHRVIALVGITGNQMDNLLLSHLNVLTQPDGYRVIGISFEQKMFQENPAFLLNFPVDGFIFRWSSLRREQQEILRRENIPAVSGSYKLDVPWLDMTDCDHETGYAMLFRHLRALGHRRIAFAEFGRGEEYQHYLERIKLFYRKNQGNDYEPELFYCRGIAPDMYEKYGEKYREVYARQIFEYLFSRKEPPTAIIAPSDICHALIREMTSKGYRIPEDVSIAEVRTERFGNELSELTALLYSEHEMMEWALKRLLLRLQDSELAVECYFQKPQLKIGSSTAPVKNIYIKAAAL